MNTCKQSIIEVSGLTRLLAHALTWKEGGSLAKNPETLLKEKVLKDLKKLPKTYARKIQQVAINGTPDILACINGYFVAIELKKDEKEKPAPIQEYDLNQIKKAGGMALVVHPLNWPGTYARLQKLAHYDEPKLEPSEEVA